MCIEQEQRDLGGVKAGHFRTEFSRFAARSAQGRAPIIHYFNACGAARLLERSEAAVDGQSEWAVRTRRSLMRDSRAILIASA